MRCHSILLCRIRTPLIASWRNTLIRNPISIWCVIYIPHNIILSDIKIIVYRRTKTQLVRLWRVSDLYLYNNIIVVYSIRLCTYRPYTLTFGIRTGFLGHVQGLDLWKIDYTAAAAAVARIIRTYVYKVVFQAYLNNKKILNV